MRAPDMSGATRRSTSTRSRNGSSAPRRSARHAGAMRSYAAIGLAHAYSLVDVRFATETLVSAVKSLRYGAVAWSELVAGRCVAARRDSAYDLWALTFADLPN